MGASKLLLCLGDPILDIYSFGTYTNGLFNTNKTIRNYGGALNVFKNAEAILSSKENYYCSWINPLVSHLPIILKDTINFYTVQRFIDEQSGFKIECSTVPLHLKDNFYSRRLGPLSIRIQVFLESLQTLLPLDKVGLIISEYNKGAFNEKADIELNGFPDFDFCVVDSRYRTVNLELLTTSKIKIWHATNTEYDPAYARNFHYTLHTNAQDPVRVLDTNGNVISGDDKRLLVPNTQITNTCGAGDTFTAAVAAYLLTQERINLETLIQASEFAITCCQEVIQTKCTTQTTVKLE